MGGLISKVEIVPGISWVEIPEANLRILCGCPAESVKHLMRRGLIRPVEVGGVKCENGPNAILLSDVMVQNGAFCNLAEFPVLQMMYRQGMLIPGHPNNTGRKPLLIGRRDVVASQLQYIYRGNYGLISEEEMVAAGAEPAEARSNMRMKLRFAFGKIQHPRDLLGSCAIDDNAETEIEGGVTIRRTGVNVFEFGYKGEHVSVNLNLPAYEIHECPYPLGASQFRREYFAVLHSGEGDGWDIMRPSMGAILVYQGLIYLIDVAPNLPFVLTALGIGVGEIEGIFHTHCHDDHFAGLTTLMQSDHRIKHFATPLVRASIAKKWAALLGTEEDDFANYFEPVDMKAGEWNDVGGLDVRPVFSPHPVETTIFVFRTLGNDGWRSYAHLADVASVKVLEGMVSADTEKPGIDCDLFKQVCASYLEPANIKKVDIGGGMIHGEVSDYRDDRSGKIILAHTSLKLTNEQKRIGSGASFGTVDTLIGTPRDLVMRSAFAILKSYFPSVSGNHLNALLNGPLRTFNPETILLKEGATNTVIYLVLTGQVELLDSERNFRCTLSAGALLGEMTGLHGLPQSETYRAESYVQALEISCGLYIEFVQKHQLFAGISMLMEGREFLQKTWLCGGLGSTESLNRLTKDLQLTHYRAGHEVELPSSAVAIVKSGTASRLLAGTDVEELNVGDFFGEESAVFEAPAFSTIVAKSDVEIAMLPGGVLRQIPSIRWRMFERFDARTRMKVITSSAEKLLMTWHDDYTVGVEQIDKQHRRLFSIASKLLDNIIAGRGQDAVAETLEKLLRYTKYHFHVEEALLARYGYAEADAHTTRHQKLLTQITEFSERIQRERLADQEVLEFLHKWIVNHILIDDRKFGPFLNERGAY